MSEGEVLVSGGEASENGEFIFRRLPPWMPRTESDGNFKLLDVVGRGFDRLDGDIAEIDEASSIQTAQSKRSIEEIAKIIDEAENMTASEIERAVEELEEVQEADISKEEVRDVFESGEVEEIEEEPEVAEEEPEDEESESKADEEAPEPDAEEAEEEVAYDEIVSGTIADAKEELRSRSRG